MALTWDLRAGLFAQSDDDKGVTAEQVRKAREQAPFKAFTIYLSDQRRFEIPHPDFVWVMAGGRTIGVADENGAAQIVDLVHVTSLEINGSKGADSPE